MDSEVLADYPLAPDVVALGEPARVFAQTPALVRAARWLARGTGLLFIAAAGGLIPFFRMIGSPQLMASGVGLIVIWGSAAVLGIFGAVLILFGAQSVASSPVYAVYPEALAYFQRGAWTIVAWDEVSQFRAPGLKSMYARLLLHDGRQITLRNDFFSPTMFYDEVQQRVVDAKCALARPAAAVP